jgi:hypothetical protein
MSQALSRERTLELLSEYREGELEPELRRQVDERLESDALCRETLEALDELARLLPALGAVPEPRAGLAERAARAALLASRPSPAPVIAFPGGRRYRPAVPSHLQAAAAVAMLVTGLAALVTGPEAPPQQAAARLVERTGLELRQQGGRLVENLRELRERVGAAVETRIDSVGDRVDDYRQLLNENEEAAPASEGRSAEEAATRVGARLSEPATRSLRRDPRSATREVRQPAAPHAPRRTT